MRRSALWQGVCLLFGVMVGLSGCSTQSAVPPITDRATLDYATASMGLPLDAYVMSPSEQNTVQAAQQVVFARCVLGTRDVPTVTLQSAAATLGFPPEPNRWVYGYWDAAYVSANGPGPHWSPYGVGQGLHVTDEQLQACVYSKEYMELEIVDAHSFSLDPEGGGVNTDLVMAVGLSANGMTLADPRFKALARARADCVKGKGFAINTNSDYQGVAFQDNWTTEQTLQAALAEAQCGDDMNFMQQAADITATYQQQLINENEAELVAIQQIIADRVQRAEQILREVGVM